MIIYSCTEKEELNTTTRKHYYGSYKGADTNSLGHNSARNFTIKEAPFGEEYIFINGVARYNNQEWVALVDQETLTISEQKFHIDDTLANGVHTVYDAIYNGTATLDTLTYKIIFHFTEKQVYKDSTRVIHWITSGKKQ